MENWPQVSDSLFGSDGASGQTHAMLDRSFPHGFLAYARTYNESADVVVDAVRHDSAHPDSVNYSVLYLYRHYIELMLKGLISLGSILEGGAGDYPTDEHRLDVLWTKLRPLLERVFPDGETSTTETVERCIGGLASLDPDGQTFRYHERCRKDKSGRRAPQPTIPSASHLDLENVRRVIGRIGGFLEGSYDAMDELLQFQADVDSEGQGWL